MRKQDILKMHGLTEAEFYKLYPTEEHYKMAMGGSSFTQFAQNGATTKNPFIAPPGAKRVDKPDAGYNPVPGQDPTAAKQYYEKMLADKDPGGPGMKQVDTPEGKKKYKEWLIEQVKNGVSPQQLIDKKKTTPDMLPELTKWYNPQYTEKTPPPPPPPKQMDLGIGWAGERTEVFGHSMPTFKDSNGKEYNLQQFKVPARWNQKDNSWDTNSGWNDPTVLSGYQKDGKFVTFDPSASKIAYEGEGAKAKGYYNQEGLKYPSYAQSGEDQKVMKTGPLRISGNTAVDVQNTGMNYNENKDTVAPINTQGTGMGIGQDKFINDVQKKNLPAATGLGNALPQGKQGGPIFNPYIPDFFNPQYLMQKGGIPQDNTYVHKNPPVDIEKLKRDKEYMKSLNLDNKYNSLVLPDPEGLPGDSTRYFPGQASFGKMPYIRDLGNLYGVTDPVSPEQIAELVKSKRAKLYPDTSYIKANPDFMPNQSKGGNVPCMNCGGYMQDGGDPSIPTLSPKDSLNMFRDVIKKMGGPAYPGQTQDSVIESKKNDFLHYIRNNTMDAIAREENAALYQNPGMMQMGGNMQDYRTDPFQNKWNPYAANPNMNNQNAFLNAANQGNQQMRQDMSNFMGATQNLMQAQNGVASTPMMNQGQPTMQTTGYVQPFDYNFVGTPKPQFTTPESVGIYPGQQPKQQQDYYTRSLEPEVNWGIAGMNAISSMFEQGQARKNEAKYKSMQGADNQFYAQPAGNRGDYDQFGNIRPNQKVPVQFAGQNFGQMGSPYQFQEGGEYYMSDDEINAIMQDGGEIDFLD